MGLQDFSCRNERTPSARTTGVLLNSWAADRDTLGRTSQAPWPVALISVFCLHYASMYTHSGVIVALTSVGCYAFFEGGYTTRSCGGKNESLCTGFAPFMPYSYIRRWTFLMRSSRLEVHKTWCIVDKHRDSFQRPIKVMPNRQQSYHDASERLTRRE